MMRRVRRGRAGSREEPWVVSIPLVLLVRAVPDFWRSRTATGDLVRARRRRQIFQSSNSNNPRYWYYLALDDGTRHRIRSWRVRQDLYTAHRQGESVTARYTVNLGHVREMRAPSTAGTGAAT
jgi:hypothetical protein